MTAYHDREWGVPVTDDRILLEHLILDTFQAGLSWAVILHKREAFREAFDEFDPAKVGRYTERKLTQLLVNPAIVRNRQKIAAAVTNTRAFLRIQEAHGSFGAFVWQFVGGRPRQNAWKTMRQIPARTICYAFMQAAGLVNDHLVSCFRHADIRALDGPRRA
jgi:DNA-3-methyladenine glycosylase I